MVLKGGHNLIKLSITQALSPESIAPLAKHFWIPCFMKALLPGQVPIWRHEAAQARVQLQVAPMALSCVSCILT